MWLDAEDDIHGLLMDQKTTTYLWSTYVEKTRQRIDQAIATKEPQGIILLPIQTILRMPFL